MLIREHAVGASQYFVLFILDTQVVEEDLWDRNYSVEKLLIHPSDRKKTSCWKGGCWVYRNEPGEFILDLGKETQVDGIELQNIGIPNTDRHAKEIKVFLGNSKDGPWNEIMSEVLPDTRTENEELPILHFATKGETLGKFLKCQILSRHGTYGGLQYFGIYTGNLITLN